MRSLRPLFLALATLLAATALHAQPAQSSGTQGAQPSGTAKSTAAGNAATTATALMATDPGYRLSTGDEIAISVHGEEDLSVARRIDKNGVIRMPYVNEISLANKTVLEAETHIQQLLIERKLLKAPHVAITVRDYFAYEVTFTGSGVQPGVYRLPREVESIEIVELFTRYGGLKPTAKKHDVKIYRKDPATGAEKPLTVNYEAMEAAKKNAATSFLIYPGDRIYVEDRLF
jgi:protein involved in polysaccharide export with SLBB domain